MLRQFLDVELKRVARDGNLLIAIIAPVVIALAVQAIDIGEPTVPVVGVVGPMDCGLVRSLDFGGHVELIELDEDRWREAFEQETVVAVLQIPDSFESEWSEELFPQVDLWVDSLHPRQTALVRLCVKNAVQELSLPSLSTVDLYEQDIRERSVEHDGSLLALWLSLSSLTSLSITCLFVVEDRESQMWDVLLRKGVPLLHLIASKLSVGSLVGFLASVVIWFFQGDFSGWTIILFLILISCFSCAMMGAAIGSTLSSVTTTHVVLSLVNILFLAPIVLSEVSVLVAKFALFSPLWHSYRLFSLCGVVGTFASQVLFHVMWLGVWAILSFFLLRITCKRLSA